MDLIAPLPDNRDQFDHIHRLLDPSHVRTFIGTEFIDLVPDGVDGLAYADTNTSRFPIDVAFSDLSEQAEVLALLRAEANGDVDATGFGPVEEDERVVVSFITSVVHAEKTRATSGIRGSARVASISVPASMSSCAVSPPGRPSPRNRPDGRAGPAERVRREHHRRAVPRRLLGREVVARARRSGRSSKFMPVQ